MRPDKIKELTLRADILAVAELMETTASEGKEFTEDRVRFVVGALRQIAASVGMLEEVSEGLRRRLSAADARIEALTIPDYLKSTRDNIAIREGRAAGKVIDLRTVFARESISHSGLAEMGDAAALQAIADASQAVTNAIAAKIIHLEFDGEKL